MLGAYPRRAGPERRNLDRVLSAVSRGSRSAPAAGAHDERRRAADGGDRPRADVGPELLLLDEPSLGLSPLLCTSCFQALGRVPRPASASCWSSRTPARAFDIADRGYLIETRPIVGQAGSATVAADRRSEAVAPSAGMSSAADGAPSLEVRDADSTRARSTAIPS